MTTDLSQLVEDFELFDNWEDRYRYLIDMGQNLPAMDDALKTEQNIVRGCTSKVWMFSRVEKDTQGNDVLRFVADSDAQIVRGLIHILIIAFEGKKIEDIKSVDMEQWFEKLGLSQHLSPNRRNGFFAMVSKIQSYADHVNSASV